MLCIKFAVMSAAIETDIIIIGEIRDGETAEIALQASETGHVVVATLHTSSASQTVQRFLKLNHGL